MGRFLEAVALHVERCQVHVECAPTQGAASLIYRHTVGMLQTVGMTWLNTGYGRAAESRCAWNMLAHADGVVAFEPLDGIGRHAVHYSREMHTRWQTGIPVWRIGSQSSRR